MAWLIFGSLLVNISQASAVYPVFSQINHQQGLSHPNIKAITQDSQGYMWFATEDGLNRYDGYQIKVYRHKVDELSSIDDNHITALLFDSADRLWVATLQGLNRYDPNKDNFVRYLPEQFGELRIFSLYEDSNQAILVGTNGNGILQVVDNTLQLKTYSLPEPERIKNRKIKAIQELNQQLFVGTDEGLFVVNESRKELKEYHFSYPGGSELFSDDINVLHENNDGELFIGSLDGLHVFNLESQDYFTLTKHPQDENNLSGKTVSAITNIGNGTLWLATDGGITVMNKEVKRFYHIKSDKNNARTLASNTITTLFKDRLGLLWVGTKSGGISLYNPKVGAFGLHKFADDKVTCVDSNNHFNIIKSATTDLWLDAYQQGLYRVNLTTGICQRHDNIVRALQRENDVINGGSLFEHSSGDIWFGTMKGSIYRLKKGQDKFEVFVGKNEDKLRPGALRAVVEDSKGNLWMGLDYGGLRYLTYQTEQYQAFIHDAEDNNSLSSNFVFSLALDQGVLWIGSETGGVDKYDIHNKRFSHYWHNRGHKNGFKSGVYSLVNDDKGYLWAGTMGRGLARIDKKTDEVRFFTTEDGLSNNTIYKVLIDNQGILWLGTNEGLSRFDPMTQQVRNYYTSDGLQGNQFNTGGFFHQSGNQMFFVGDQGVNIFNPLDIMPDQGKPHTVISQFLLFNRPQDSLLKVNGRQEQYLELDYQQNLFSFTFAGLHYIDPQRQHYQYKLQGFDQDWRTSSYKQRIATYTNLDPGQYFFRVKSSNHQGVWGEETRVEVIIHPPLWLTWWAKLSYVALIFFLLTVLYRYRTRVMRARTLLLESRVKLRTHELSKEKRRVETLLKNKAKEFENISHEFRTPLAIIIGRTQQQLKGELSAEQKSAFELIGNIGKRLSLTVDDVIAMARFTQLEQEKSFRKTSISTLVSEICLQMSSYAALKQQRFLTDIAPDIFQCCQPCALEKLVNNLISNAIKYTYEQGEISIVLRKTEVMQYQLIVKDTGVGIDKQHQQAVFERFYRCDEGELSSSGSGIGLSLVRDVVELHQGQITLSSEPGKGCEFTVTFSMTTPPAETKKYDITPDNIEIMMAADEAQIEPGYDNAQTTSELPLLLLVEDNAQLRLLLQEQLAGRYQLLCAKNGEQGVAMAIKQVPQIILSDINMPKMDGYQLLDKVKNHPGTSHIQVILLTAKSDAHSRVIGFKYRADGYIGKPYHLEELLAVLEAQHFNREKIREHITGLLGKNEPLTNSGLDEYSNEVINKCVTYIAGHYQEPSLSVKTLLDIACLSERQLQRKFQETLGMTPGEFIKVHRLKCAQSLLRQSIKVNDVALRVGFSSANHFSRQYKEKFGLAPSQESKHSVE